MHAAFDRGINVIDTADVDGDGHAERLDVRLERPRASQPPCRGVRRWRVPAMTDTSRSTWSGYCGDAIRLRNHRMLVRTIWLLGIGSSLIWLHPQIGDPRYWTAFLRGPGAGGGGYFAVEQHRDQAHDLLLVFGIFSGLGVYTGRLYVQRRLDFMRHPFARKLALRGPVETVAAEIDAQYANAHKRIGPMVITAEWLLHETYWKVVPMRHADVVWVFQTQIATNWPELNVIVRDRFGETIESSHMTIKGKARLLKRVFALAPHAIQGYDRPIQELWNSSTDKSSFPETVKSRYPARVTSGIHQI